MIEKFEQLAKEDPRILSAFLGGTLADGTADDLSDIDVYYLIDEQSYSEFHSRVRDWLKNVGQLVFFEEHSNFGFDLLIFIYLNGVKGELGLGTSKNMMNMHAGPTRYWLTRRDCWMGSSSSFRDASTEKIFGSMLSSSFAGIGTGTTSSSPPPQEEGYGLLFPISL